MAIAKCAIKTCAYHTADYFCDIHMRAWTAWYWEEKRKGQQSSPSLAQFVKQASRMPQTIEDIEFGFSP